ncbi:hypothetical protein MmiAt1_01760 [Methanimicrococcus sp. At1]|uniref:Uncharacterized protein n=1 Tax=Methanimicrococcus hacksteinii TaxID=3028293 RepID=A0ABU3VML1_9EURY|nr:hypothetical protein [Methanimicrococcus sp. At1]MDV0444644.1 hypothetical protein [Methanimicrococcus sp. At1]
MRIHTKFICCAVLFIAVTGLITPAFGFNDFRYSAYHNMTAEAIQKVVDETTGTQIDRFDELQMNSDVLAVYGIIPEKAKGIEAYEYWLQMGNISKALSKDPVIQRMHYSNGGAVIGQGTQCVCYTSIIIWDERADEFTEEDMLAVKERVDYYASLEGLSDSPIVFFKSKMADSYLTEEQVLELWESGYGGLIINDGHENLTPLRDGLNTAPDASAFSSASVDLENTALSGDLSFIERLLSVFSIFKSDDYTEFPADGRITQKEFADEKIRPIVGGLMVATSTSGGTVGYAAKDISDSDIRGIVTVAHVFHFENKTAYQPRQGYTDGNKIGFFTKMSKDGDSVFIPMNSSDVKAAIYTGEGDDRILDVIGHEGSVSSGMLLRKSGMVSGNTEGTYYGVRYNQTFTVKNGTINYTVDHVGVIKESSADSYSVPGDSGGPIYLQTDMKINGTEKDVAVLLGILEGGDGNGTVYYVPCTEIKENINVVPLTIYDY